MQYLKAASKYLGSGNPQNSMYKGGMRKQNMNARYREAVSHGNIAGRPRSGLLAELNCKARAAFRHEMKFL